MSFLTLADLGQATNRIQADNAYSAGRAAVSRGDLRAAKLSLAELQFTYNNAKNAGAQDEAGAILRLHNMLAEAIDPSLVSKTPPTQFQIDRAALQSGNQPDIYLKTPEYKPNYPLFFGLGVGAVAAVGLGVWWVTK